MQKPMGWDDVQPIIGSDSSPLPAGKYNLIVVNANERYSKNGKLMLAIALDIAEGEYANYFQEAFDRRKQYSEKATWPAGGMYYQLVGDQDNTQSMGRFKGLLTAFELDNPGFTWEWGDGAERRLIGKVIGGVFREEEYVGNDGKVHTSTKIAYLMPTADLETAKVPEKKCLKPEEKPATEEDIPF